MLPSTRTRRRVFIIDDHPLVREWLANVINQQADLIVCGHAEGRDGCIEAMQKKRPDVAIVDISLKDCTGFELIAEIKQQVPGTRMVVLSMHDSPLYARRAIRAGASGYVVKRETTRKICAAIRNVLDGHAYVSEQSGDPETLTTPEEVDLSLLSDREAEIFRLLGLGNSTRQIADSLSISIKTVQVHSANIREKLGIRGSTELLSAAVRWNERHAVDSV
jgi:DNA-binding NarL/FixJ family response regulator